MTAHWWVGGYGPDMGGIADGVGLMATRPDGSLEFVSTVSHTLSPGFLAAEGNRLFAAAEGTGTVEVFTVADDLTLAQDGVAQAGGTFPCHLTIFGDRVAVSNYLDGSVGILRGRELEQVIPGTDSASHAHSTLMLDATTMVSLDLGTDSLHLYEVSSDEVVRTGSVRLPAGTGPRDIARRGHAGPDSELLYVLGELAATLTVVSWDGARLEVVASTPLPGAERGDHAAGIALCREFIYVGLRGSNRISILRSASDGRTVEPVGFVDCAGDWPRHLVTDGDVLHVANEKSGTIASFRLADYGMPNLIGTPSPAPSPTFLLAATGRGGPRF